MERSEIRVTVGGEECAGRPSEDDDTNTTVSVRPTVQYTVSILYLLISLLLLSMSVLLQMKFQMMLQLWYALHMLLLLQCVMISMSSTPSIRDVVGLSPT